MKLKLKVFGNFHRVGGINFSVNIDEDGVIDISKGMAKKVLDHLCSRWNDKYQRCACIALPLDIYDEEGMAKFSDEFSAKIKEAMLEVTAKQF